MNAGQVTPPDTLKKDILRNTGLINNVLFKRWSAGIAAFLITTITSLFGGYFLAQKDDGAWICINSTL